MNQRFLQGALLAFLGSMAFEATAEKFLAIVLEYDGPPASRGATFEETRANLFPVKIKETYVQAPPQDHEIGDHSSQSVFLNLEAGASDPYDIKNLLFTLPKDKKIDVSVDKKMFSPGETPENGEVIFTVKEGGAVVNTFTYPYQISKIMANPKGTVGRITLKVSDDGLNFEKNN